MSKTSFYVATALALSLVATVASAAKRTFRGRAAAAIYICDMSGTWDCWFAKGRSYCSIDFEEDAELWSTPPQDFLVVGGGWGQAIWDLTHHCSDKDKLKPYYFGRQGISCEKQVGGAPVCLLEIDAIF